MPPIICGFCHKRRREYVIKNDSFGLCSECMKKLPFSDGNSCFEAKSPIDYLIAPFYYEGAIKASLHLYKFKGQFAYSDIYSHFIVKSIRNIPGLDKFDIACAIPLSNERMIERGYNQSEIIARKVCDSIDMDYSELLVRVRDTKRQSELDTLQRVENMKDAFECVEDVCEKRILLFDDIYTHGITVAEAAKTLKNSGAANIVCITVAKVKTKEREIWR